MIWNPSVSGGGGGIEMSSLSLSLGMGAGYAYFGMTSYEDSDFSPPQNPVSVPVGSFLFLQCSLQPSVSGMSLISSCSSGKYTNYVYSITGSASSATA